jgi:hypothetical protein
MKKELTEIKKTENAIKVLYRELALYDSDPDKSILENCITLLKKRLVKLEEASS